MKYYIIVENTEEEVLFQGYIDDVPSIEELKIAIEEKFYPVLGRYYIATEEPVDFYDKHIVYCNYDN